MELSEKRFKANADWTEMGSWGEPEQIEKVRISQKIDSELEQY